MPARGSLGSHRVILKFGASQVGATPAEELLAVPSPLCAQQEAVGQCGSSGGGGLCVLRKGGMTGD